MLASGGRDGYTGKFICHPSEISAEENHNELHLFDLDHIIELHCIANIIHGLPEYKQSSILDKSQFVFQIRDNFVNKLENLVVTASTVNVLKFNAHQKFFADFQKGITADQGIHPYLVSAFQDEDVKLSRGVSRNIMSATERAFNYLSSVVDNGEIGGYLAEPFFGTLNEYHCAMHLS